MSDWPSVSAPPEAWSHLDTQVLSVAAATITFSGIAAAAAPRLRIYIYIIKDGTAGLPQLRFNNDSAGNYANQNINAVGAVVVSARVTAQTQINLNTNDNIDNGAPGLYVYTIEKPVAGEVGRVVGSTAYISQSVAINLEANTSEWSNTGALINRVDVISSATNFDAGTRVVLEGAA